MSAFTHLQRFPSVYQYKTDASVLNLPSPSRIYIIPSVKNITHYFNPMKTSWKTKRVTHFFFSFAFICLKRKKLLSHFLLFFLLFQLKFFWRWMTYRKNNLFNYEYCTSQQGVFPSCWNVRLSMHKTEPACWVQISAVFVVFIFAYLWEKY